jgi:hypothetical protein
MRVATLVLTAALVAGAADAAAHGRGFVPFFGAVVIVPAPVAPGKNQITVQGPPQPPGASAGAHARGEATMPSTSPGFQGGFHRRHHHAPPAPQPVPATSDGALGRAPARVGASGPSFSSMPPSSSGAPGRSPARVGGSGQAFSNETRVTDGPGTHGTPSGQLLFSRDTVIETPYILILE